MGTAKAIALFSYGCFDGCYWQSSDETNLWNGFRRRDNTLFDRSTGNWAKTESEIITWIIEEV
jgi:hypothetical protein